MQQCAFRALLHPTLLTYTANEAAVQTLQSEVVGHEATNKVTIDVR